MAKNVPLAELTSRLGTEFGPSSWVPITQALINDFARVTGDHQWMHVDVERATREQGGTIAHGLLIACLLPQLQEEIMHVTDYASGFSYGFDKLRFTQPVRPGQRVRLKQLLSSVTPKNGGQLVTLRSTVEIDGEARPALVADYVALYYA